MPDDRWRALGLGRQPAPGPRVPEFPEEQQEGFLGRLGSLLGTDQPSLASRMQAQGQRQRTRLPDGTAADLPMPGTPEFDAAVDVAGAFDFLGPIKAYHGSPHTFDAFSLGKVGTGEGAQAFGYGLYFAENPKTAENYRNLAKTAPGTWKVDGEPVGLAKLHEFIKPPEGIKPSAQYAATANIANDLKYGASLDEAIAKNKQSSVDDVEYQKAVDAFQKQMKGRITYEEPGATYTVNLAVEPEDLLDWDLPLSQQPEKVRKALRDSGMLPSAEGSPYLASLPPEARSIADRMIHGGESDRIGSAAAKDWATLERLAPDVDHNAIHDLAAELGAERRGNDFYEGIGDPVEAAQSLRAAGIPGLRYLDQGSRAGGEGTRNVVLFDDTLAEILERNGQPVPRK